MAKLIINIGEEANDGTGDPIRSAMSKTNANFTELYDNIGDLTLLDLSIEDGEDGQVLTANGDGTFSFAAASGGGGGGGSYADADVDTHLNTSSSTDNQILSWDGSDYEWIDAPSGGGGSYANADVDAHLNNSSIASGKILGWNGSDYAWVDQAGSGSSYTDSDAIAAVTGSDLDMGGRKVLFGNVYSGLNDLPDAGTYHGMFAHVHGTGKAYFAHSGQWQELANAGGGGSGSLPSRTSPSAATASIADGVSTDIDITGYKGYALYTITTSHAAWVTLYTDNSSRQADNARGETEDPAPDSGVIAEVITSSGNLKVAIAPGVIGYNLETTPTTNIPVKVRNKNGSAAAITVAIEILQLEA